MLTNALINENLNSEPKLLSIGSGPSYRVMEQSPPYPGSIPISDMTKLQAFTESSLPWVSFSNDGKCLYLHFFLELQTEDP